MNFTLNDCLARINQVLNYPALAYEDVYHFFDQAIAELNTNLRIALPSVSEMRLAHTFEITAQEGLVRLEARPTNTTTLDRYTSADALPQKGTYAYVCGDSFTTREFYKYQGTIEGWVKVPALYGIYLNDDGSMDAYTAVPISTSTAVWTPVGKSHVAEFDLTEYLPIDWWTLFVIPYVCFKFAVRNGDSGELFVDEYTQGFQQLQSSYNVPNSILLIKVAGRPAYTELVKQYIGNLAGTMVFTRAIYEDMRVGNGIAPVYNEFYTSGGWI